MSDSDEDDGLPETLKELAIDGRDQYLEERDEDAASGVEPDDDGHVEFPVQSPTVDTVSVSTGGSDSGSDTESDSDDTTMSTNESGPTGTGTGTGTRSNGETVDATPPEDPGETTTEWIASHVDREALTDRQAEIIRTAVRHPDWSQTKIADELGASRSTVSAKLREHDIDHPSIDEPAKDEEAYEELLQVAKNHPNATISGIADAVGANKETARRVLNRNIPDHRSVSRPAEESQRISGYLSVDDSDSLRPYATTRMDPPEGVEPDTRPEDDVKQSHSDSAGDETETETEEDGDLNELVDDLDIEAADGEAPDADPWDETEQTPAQERLEAVRERAGVIARVTESEEVVNVCRELYQTAGGDGSVTNAGR